MLSRRQVTKGALLLGVPPLIWRDGRSLLAQEETAAVDAVLDGTAPVDAEALAALARERAKLAADWLTEAQRPTGVFYYFYDPVKDEYEIEQYNDVRHAGTAWSLYQAYGLLGDESVLATAEGAGDYIQKSTVPIVSAGEAYLDVLNGDTSLGGQALALVALMERRRVTARTDIDELIHEMADFLLWMEYDERNGQYYNSYKHRAQRKLPTPEVVFYPGEALLALTKLAQQFPDGPYLEAATRAANYLVRVRDGDIPTAGVIPRQDHWLTIALSELYRLEADEGYAAVAYLQADAMIAGQYTAEDGEARNIGGARREGPISYTSTATKGEAIVAAWGLATFRGDDDAAARFALGAQRNAQYQLRMQYTEANTTEFTRPDLTIGGWAANDDDRSIRIDYVQHNMSVLVGLCHLTIDGDVPIAEPLSEAEQ